MSWYCKAAKNHPVHGPYHDDEYGFPLKSEAALFERLCLEIFQAGLSWEIVLKKRKGLMKAFHGFRVSRVAVYKALDIRRLMADESIIRNRRKIEAVIENAKRVRKLRKEYGSFATFIARHHPRTHGEWVKLFKQHFVFMGGEIVNEFLMSIAYLPGAHHPNCPVHRRIRKDYDLPHLAARKKGFRYI